MGYADADVQKYASAENDFRRDIENAYNVTLIPAHEHCEIDYYVDRDGEIVAYIEIKTREYKSTAFRSFTLDLSKFMAFQKYDATGVPVFLYVRWNDGIDHWYQYQSPDTFTIKHGGRTTKTRSKLDLKPVVHIPMNLFKELKK